MSVVENLLNEGNAILAAKDEARECEAQEHRNRLESIFAGARETACKILAPLAEKLVEALTEFHESLMPENA